MWCATDYNSSIHLSTFSKDNAWGERLNEERHNRNERTKPFHVLLCKIVWMRVYCAMYTEMKLAMVVQLFYSQFSIYRYCQMNERQTIITPLWKQTHTIWNCALAMDEETKVKKITSFSLLSRKLFFYLLIVNQMKNVTKSTWYDTYWAWSFYFWKKYFTCISLSFKQRCQKERFIHTIHC